MEPTTVAAASVPAPAGGDAAESPAAEAAALFHLVLVEVTTAANKKIEYPVPPLVQLVEVRQYLLEATDSWFITRFHFATEDGSAVSDYVDVASLLPPNALQRPPNNAPAPLPRLKLRVIPIPYDMHSALFHLRTLRKSVAFTPAPGRSMSMFYSIAGTREDVTGPPRVKGAKPSKSHKKNLKKKQRKAAAAVSSSPGDSTATAAAGAGSPLTDEPSESASAASSAAAAAAAAAGAPTRELTSVMVPTDATLDAASLEGFFPPAIDSFPRSLRSLKWSAWNPVRPHRRVRGDLLYLEAETLEGRHIFITCAERGFFVNESTTKNFNPSAASSDVFATLPALLNEASPLFKGNFAAYCKRRSKLDILETLPLAGAAMPWLAPNPAGEDPVDAYCSTGAEDELLRVHGFLELPGQSRDWNEEFQVLYARAQNQEHHVSALNNLCRVHGEFVAAAQAGTVMVVNGEVAPLNPYDPPEAQMFHFNGIFFSMAANVRGVYDGLGGPIAAHKNVTHDLLGVHLLRAVGVRDLHACATAVVDYRGRRVVCQSVVPGLLSQSAQSVDDFRAATTEAGVDPLEAAMLATPYGPSDDLKTFSEEPSFAALAKELCDQLMITTNVVDFPATGKRVTVSGPLEMRGLVGGDKRKYLFELVRLLPRDPNFPAKEHSYYLLRNELVQQFRDLQVSSALHRHQQKLAAKAQEAAEKKAADPNAPEAPAVPEEPLEIPDLRMNVNCFVYSDRLVYEADAERQRDDTLLESMGAFLLQSAMPRFVEQYHAQPSADVTALVPLMHEFGINARYLGTIAARIPPESALHVQCVEEIITRSAKALLRAQLAAVSLGASAEVAASFLNHFLGVRASRGVAMPKAPFFGQQQLWDDIKAEASKRFPGFVLTLDLRLAQQLRRLAMLRSLCKAVGITLLARAYDFAQVQPFTADDVLTFQPLAKHYPPQINDIPELITRARAMLSQQQYFLNGIEALEQAIQAVYHILGPHSTYASEAHQLLASAFFKLGDPVSAVQHMERAVLILERLKGVDDASTVRAYGNLALYYSEAGHPERALPFIRRALYLSRLVAGSTDPRLTLTYLNLAMVLQASGDLVGAARVLRTGLSIAELPERPDKAIITRLCRALATTHEALGQFKDAMEYEKRCNRLLLQFYPADHEKVVESNELLSKLTGAAVSVAKTQRQQQPAFAAPVPATSVPQRRGVLPKPGMHLKSALPFVGKGARK